ncbi:hypothetical protein [Rhodococcoides fascians]|uniref:hypothetical protein n=1 Tax=Rhodococcoides fascians TaxID=1828 RepID=UPI0012D339FF|nr:hypothetical protein [Rhodococcus fascians]
MTERRKYVIEVFIEDRLDELPRKTPGDRLLRDTVEHQVLIGRAQAEHIEKHLQVVPAGALPMPWLIAAGNWRHHKDFRPEWEL